MTTLWPRINATLLMLVLFALIALIGMVALRAEGGPLDPPGTPDSTDSVRLPGTPINGPINITVPGHYYLTRNIALSGAVSGILVSSSDVSIDLGGFTISGNDTVSTYGILIGAVSRVEVRNGHIRDFNVGLDAGAASLVTIRDIHVSSNERGITLGWQATLSNCSVRLQTETGVYVTGWYSVISACSVEGNEAPGVTLEGSRNVLESSLVQNNNRAFANDSADVYISGDANVVKDNTMGASPNAVILIGVLNHLIDNVCVLNGIAETNGPVNVVNNVVVEDHRNDDCGV